MSNKGCRSRLRKLLVALAVLTVLIAGSLLPMIIDDIRDVEEVKYPDLMPETCIVADEDNAYLCLSNACEVLVWPETNDLVTVDYLENRMNNNAYIAEIIEQNKEAIELFNSGTKLPNCYARTFNYDARNDVRNLMRLMACKAKYERVSGLHPDAVSTCCALLWYVNQSYKNPHGPFLSGTLQSSLSLITPEIVALCRDEKAPLDSLKQLSVTLKSIKRGGKRLVQIMKYMFEFTMENISDHVEQMDEINIGFLVYDAPGFVKKWKLPSYMYQPNQVKATSASYLRNAISNAVLPYAQMNLLPAYRQAVEEENKYISWLLPNSAGKRECISIADICENALVGKCHAESDISALRLILALKIFHREKGSLPASLEELTPDYMDEIPRDPFDGQPFRYAPSKVLNYTYENRGKANYTVCATGVVYSVGRDLIDSGGSVEKNDFREGKYHRTGSRWSWKDAVYAIDETVTVERVDE